MPLVFSRSAAPSRPAPVLLYILHSGNLFGTERMALATLEGMREYDKRVVFAPAAWAPGSVQKAAVDAGFEAVTFDSRWSLLRALLPWFIRYRSIDVMGTGVVHSLACHLLSRMFDVRLRQLHVAHGGTAESLDRKRMLNRIPVLMVAVSEFVRQKLMEQGVFAEKITVIDNFLSDAQIGGHPKRLSYDPARPSSRPVDLKAMRVAIVSRLDAFKRIDVLVESNLPCDLPNIQFDIYGTGDQFDLLKARSAGMPNVHLHGFVPDIEQRLVESDVLLHLCPNEPFGLVILEAFRAGLVVIGPSSGGAGQLIEEGVTGLRFSPNSSQDLGRVLRQVQAMNGAELQRIADAGYRRLNERFAQAEGVRRYREALSVAGAMKRPVPRALPEPRHIDSLMPPSAGGLAAGAQPGDRMQILCIMRMPPDPNGHGGSQRAWRLLQALVQHGTVHFVLIYREQDRDCMEASLDPIMPLVASVNRVCIAEWQPMNRRRFGVVPGRVWDVFSMGSQDAPRLPAAALRAIAERLPCRDFDVVFAGRLCCAVVAQSLLDRKLLSTALRVVDFDDIMSKFALRQLRSAGASLGLYRRAMVLIDSLLVARSENRIADEWHAVSVCTDQDVAALEAANPRRGIAKIPNVVARSRLAARSPDGRFRVLFTGNLGFAPNIDGLRLFVEQAWPTVLREVPTAELTVVGLNPSASLVELAERHSFELHANVPSLEPYYRACDVVIAPIMFGSGTRIKILEAMAYGRPVVSTTVGAEGMALVHGRQLLLADHMSAFAEALIQLAREPARAHALADEAFAFQQAHYTPAAFDAAVASFLQTGRRSAAAQQA